MFKYHEQSYIKGIDMYLNVYILKRTYKYVHIQLFLYTFFVHKDTSYR